MASRLEKPVIIMGGGAWGLSTALHMHEAGYIDITVYERASEMPSRYSAAWDLNKIVRAEYEDPFYVDLALDAIEGWKTPLFGPYYHQTGYVVCTTGRAPEKATHHLLKALSNIEEHPVFAPEIRRLNNKKDFLDHTWQYSGPLTGFTGYFNRIAGYAHSGDAVKGIWEHCTTLGIKFVMGESTGRIAELLYADEPSGSTSSRQMPVVGVSHGSSTETEPTTNSPSHKTQKTKSRKCIGVKTADGKRHYADLTICALGAWGASLIPELGNFTVARCWSVAHVQLTQKEADRLRNIPTTNVRDLGFFFEPDPKTNLFKLCPLGAGYTNTDSRGISLPPSDVLPPPQDYIPIADERKLRQLLRETFPWMADRPFVDQKLCWFNDSADSEFCIDYVPGTEKSLVILSGDSGHGFKMMPVFGKWVVDLLNKNEQSLERWQWRTTDARGRDWGNQVSWRIGNAQELKDLMKEKARSIQARL